MALFARKKPAPAPVVAPPEEPLPRRSGAEHAAAVLEGVESLAPAALPVAEVAGLELCEEIVSDLDVPLVATARVAGYGVRAANIVGATPEHPIDLLCVAELDRRDAVAEQAVAPGACVLLEEGVPLPRGVDAVVPTDLARRSGRTVLFSAEARLGQYVAARGSQVPEGQVLLRPGVRLGPRELALLAVSGLDRVLVRPRPRVVVLSVGPDLVPIGAELTALNQAYPAAVPLVGALAEADEAGVRSAEPLPRLGDEVRAALDAATADADVVLVVAQQEADAHLVAHLLDADLAHVELGAGHGAAVATRAGARVLVLPADPVAAHVAYLTWCRPLLARLAGRRVPDAERRAVLAHPVRPGRPRLVPVRLEGERAVPLPDAGELLVAASADAVLQAGSAGLDAGAEVVVVPLDPASA